MDENNNNNRLPKGLNQKYIDMQDWYSVSSSSGWDNNPGVWGYPNDPYDTNENNDPPFKTTDMRLNCQCGVFTTYGIDVHPSLHSEWCQLYKKDEGTK